MKSSVIFLLLAAAAAAPAQPVPEWTSPILGGSYDTGSWIILRQNPPELRFYREDNDYIHIMDGEYSTNIAVTILKPADFWEWSSLGYDVTGDGIFDLYIKLESTPVEPWYYGYWIIDPMNGLTVYDFYNPSFSYELYNLGIPDIDNDGWNELVFRRSITEGPLGEFRFLVYQTNGHAGAQSQGAVPSPSTFSLNQNYPNPFNPATNITYEVAQPEAVEIQIFDPAGRLVRIHNAGVQAPGPHKWIWDGKNDGGSSVASGVYFYTLSAGGRTEAKKMIMLR